MPNGIVFFFPPVFSASPFARSTASMLATSPNSSSMHVGILLFIFIFPVWNMGACNSPPNQGDTSVKGSRWGGGGPGGQGVMEDVRFGLRWEVMILHLIAIAFVFFFDH